MGLTKVEQLVKFDGEKVVLDGDEFIFRIDGDLSGIWATFRTEVGVGFVIWATVGHDNQPVPLSLDVGSKTCSGDYAETVNRVPEDWFDYIKIVGDYWRRMKRTIKGEQKLEDAKYGGGLN